MSEGENGSTKLAMSPYDEAMDALSSLITKRTRADKSNSGDRYDLMFDYLKILELDEPISQMKVIHVAGTKGKGSTCTFTEAILRNCGFHTGLFTSPHLIDVRERFRLDGVDICKEKFLAYFWWCFDRLKERTDDDITPMPTYFRFLALLAFKIFAGEQVDVVILEVGLGGKFDATNVVQSPIVCGISSLGYDHMEILDTTMVEEAGSWKLYGSNSAGEEFPPSVFPADEAMHVLEETASSLDVPLRVATPLDPHLLSGQHLGLHGDHQYVNAGLAIALSSTWLQKTGHLEFNYLDETSSLPEQFIKGLTTAALQGRAQVVPDQFIDIERQDDLVFYLDGAHSPESMEVCAKWFALAIKQDNEQPKTLSSQLPDDSSVSEEALHVPLSESLRKNSSQILLFNCMSVRDPQLLLPRLINTCASHGVHFKQALFVPNVSVYNKVGTSNVAPIDSQVDLSWQLTLQRLYEFIIRGEKGHSKGAEITSDEVKEESEGYIKRCENSTVFPSLPLAIKWLRDNAQRNQSVRYQVLVTGSLHLIGDVLKLIKK